MAGFDDVGHFVVDEGLQHGSETGEGHFARSTITAVDADDDIVPEKEEEEEEETKRRW